MRALIGCVTCVKLAIIGSSISLVRTVSTLTAVTVKPDTVGCDYFGCDATLSATVEPTKLGKRERSICQQSPTLPIPPARNNRSSKSP